MSKLEYTEYQSVVDLINKADQDNVYQELIGKETKTLDTINRVVKYYNDNDYKKKEFVNMSFYELVIRFGDIWGEIYSDFISMKSTNILNIFMKNDRPIYIGFLLIIISFFILFIYLSE
jgi:hypothetical protein